MKSNRFVQEAVDKQLKKTHDEGRKLRSDNMIGWMVMKQFLMAGRLGMPTVLMGWRGGSCWSWMGQLFLSFFWQRQALDHLKKSGYQKMDRKWKIPMQWFLNSDWRMSRGRKAALEEIRNRGQYAKGGHKEV